jgi:osmotically-inducible protein OsmY/predicted transcriptional regulator
MQVKAMMTQPVIVVQENTPLAEVARTLLERGIGCVPVVNGQGEINGLITESNFAREGHGVSFTRVHFPPRARRRRATDGIERAYQALRTVPASAIMTREVYTMTETALVDEVVHLMLKEGIHHVPVVRNRVPVGIVTRHDLLRMVITRPLDQLPYHTLSPMAPEPTVSPGVSAFTRPLYFPGGEGVKSDKTLKEDVLHELIWEPSLEASHIGVLVEDGTVTLIGEVQSYGEAWSAVRAAGRVFGVRGVIDKLEVQLPSASQRSDVELAHMASEALRWNHLVPQERISVAVVQGVITLQGEVDWDYQRQSAVDSVRQLTGVKRVANLITLKPRLTSFDVETEIHQAFARHAQLDADHIHVEVEGNKITLRGTVRSWAERRAAETVDWAAPGVAEVEDKLEVA